MSRAEPNETAVLGGGCFWCMEAVYHHVPGIQSITSGYAGGTTPNPSYQQVCSGKTDHAEVLRLEYDPSKVSYAQILKLFWKAHDPTTRNRQGADEGTQYRSILLTVGETQRETAERSKKAAQMFFRDPIVTEITPLDVFYPAEEYHQQYHKKNPSGSYTQGVIQPKLQKLQKEGALPP